MTPSEKLSQRYAEIFVSVFERIQGDPSSPLLVSSKMPQGGANGTPFRGTNALLTSLVSARRGFGIPIWLTRSKIGELGLLIHKGEHGTPIVHYDVFYENVETRKRDPAMDDAAYRLLSDEEKEKWVKRCYLNYYPEFNIAQTNFDELYPAQWDELVQEFGTPALVDASCEDLDRLLTVPFGEQGSWLCPVVLEQDRQTPVYREPYDDILVGAKESYGNRQRWYADLVHEMAHSTGSEGRMDRNLSSGVLDERAQEELRAELASATVCTMLGLQTGLQEHNLGFLKGWCNAMKEEPSVIYKAVNDSARIAELIVGTLGIGQRKGFNLDQMMQGVEEAEARREKAYQRREEYKRKGGKARRPVKAPGKKKGLHI